MCMQVVTLPPGGVVIGFDGLTGSGKFWTESGFKVEVTMGDLVEHPGNPDPGIAADDTLTPSDFFRVVAENGGTFSFYGLEALDAFNVGMGKVVGIQSPTLSISRDFTPSTSGSTLDVAGFDFLTELRIQGDWALDNIRVRLSTTAAVCGNGALEDSEQCDDGNTTPNDGCSATCEADASSAGFAAAGGYRAYLAEPGNAEKLNALLGSTTGPCDEAAALDHWLRAGRSDGLAFARGKLRTDVAGGATDPDYAIDGGFSWDYDGYKGMTNTVVFIEKDAPKPFGWAGRALLLERCQNFNLGSAYRARDYASINTDVRDAIDGKLIPGFSSVTDHYVKYGFKEGRLTNSGWTRPQLDAWSDAGYLAANPDVNTFFQGSQNEGWVAFGKIGFAHWINFGPFEMRPTGQ